MLCFVALIVITLTIGMADLTNFHMIKMAARLNQGILGVIISISINTLKTTIEHGNYVIATIISLVFCGFLGLDVIILFFSYGYLVFKRF